MSSPIRAIYTCTPVAFHANRGFHIRDTGLIARHLRRLGLQSKCIMPLPYYDDDDDLEHLIRVDMDQLKDAAWWRSLSIDGVVLYSWAAPKYNAIARAIHQAGLKLLLHLDSNGRFWGLQWEQSCLLQKLKLCIRIPITDFLRARHMRYADYITAAPPVTESLRHRLFYGSDIANKGRTMACPVACECAYNGSPKQPLILFIGRWDDLFQKRPEYMMAALEHLFGPLAPSLPEGTCAAIFGKLTPELKSWHGTLPGHIRQAVQLKGYVDNAQLPAFYSRAQILACNSRYESSHIVAAEALCCGASIVSANRPGDLRAVHWYTTKDSGRIAQQDTPESFAESLRDELLAWQSGARSPQAIASTWQPLFHADQVMARVFDLSQTSSGASR